MRPVLTAYLLILPAAVFIGVVFLYSLARLGYVSVHTGNNGDEGPAQLDNYRFILDDPIFRDAVKHNLLLLLSVPVVLVLALAIAFVLHEGIRGWRVYRTIIFLPYMLAIPVLGTTFVYLLSLNGVINTVLGAVGLGFLEQDWLGDPSWVLQLDRVDHRLPRARLRRGAVPRAAAEPAGGGRPGGPHRRLHLVAAASAASRCRRCASVITAFVTLELITMLSWVFAYVYSTTRGGPNFASYVLEFYVFDNAFTFRSPSFAAASAILLLLATTVLIIVQVRRTSVEVEP